MCPGCGLPWAGGAMTVQDTRDPRDTAAGSGSNARVLVGVLCVVAVLACVVMPLFGWIVAFAVAIRFAVLARRAVDPSLFRVAGWAMVALGLVNVAVIAVLWSGSDQVELTRDSGLGLSLPGSPGSIPMTSAAAWHRPVSNWPSVRWSWPGLRRRVRRSPTSSTSAPSPPTPRRRPPARSSCSLTAARGRGRTWTAFLIRSGSPPRRSWRYPTPPFPARVVPRGWWRAGSPPPRQPGPPPRSSPWQTTGADPDSRSTIGRPDARAGNWQRTGWVSSKQVARSLTQ